jgi:hypothetical protein
MTKTELLKMIDDDLDITPENLEGKLYTIPALHSKYLRYFFDFKNKANKRRRELNALYKEKWIFYKEGEDLLDKKELQFHILADEEYAKMHYETQVLDDLVDVLDRTVKRVNGLSFDVKNLIEYLNR